MSGENKEMSGHPGTMLSKLLARLREPGMVVATLLVATAIQWLFHHWNVSPISFAPYFLAVVATALLASAAAAWATLVAGGALSWLLFQRSEFPGLSMQSVVNVLVYACTAGVLLIIIRRLRNTQEALRGRDRDYANSQNRLRALFNSSSEGLTFCRLMRDEQGKVVDYMVLDVNPAHAIHATATREEMLNRPVTQIRPPVDPRWIDTATEAVSTGKSVEFDVRNRFTGHWLNIRVSPVEGDYFCQAFIDVTDRHRLEEQRASLLAEMNHRVKNNFQMIGAMLDLQSRRSNSAQTREHLEAAARRVQVLAELHAGLSNEADTTQINFKSYLVTLTEKLRATIDNPQHIQLNIEADEAILATDKALPLGFLINEIVTNSIKHAFPADRAGVITLCFKRGNQGYVLTVSDNGRGLPETPEPAGKDLGMGMRLITALAAQVGTKVELTRQPSVSYEIRIQT